MSLPNKQLSYLKAHPMIRRIGMPIAILTFYFLVPIGSEDAPIGMLFGVLVSVACIGVVSWLVVAEARRAQRRLRVEQLFVAFELVLVGFSLGYYLLSVDRPGEIDGLHTRLDALYFSLTSMSTVGFGDITATGQLGRLLVTVQIAFSLVFVATVVALLQDQLRTRRQVGDDRDTDS